MASLSSASTPAPMITCADRKGQRSGGRAHLSGEAKDLDAEQPVRELSPMDEEGIPILRVRDFFALAMLARPLPGISAWASRWSGRIASSPLAGIRASCARLDATVLVRARRRRAPGHPGLPPYR